MQLTYLEHIEAIRLNINQQWAAGMDSRRVPASGKSRGSLTSLVNQGLDNLENRYAVLGFIVDRPIESSSGLSQHECSVLIDYLKAPNEWRLSDEGYDIISGTESRVSTQRTEAPLTPEPEDDGWIDAVLSDLQLAGF